jgi:glycosyltransferase involved in cell wall biosynthesis
MRILHIAPGYYPTIGGAEAHVRGLSESLVKSGHDVTVFTTLHRALMSPQRKESIIEHEVLNGVKIRRFRSYYGVSRLMRSIWNVPGGYRLSRYILDRETLQLLYENPLHPRLVFNALRFKAEIMTIIDWFNSLATEVCAATRIWRVSMLALPLFHTEEQWSGSSLFPRILDRCASVLVKHSV